MEKREYGSSHLLLFVTGIPSKACHDNIDQCLQQYGTFRLLSLKHCKTGSKIVESNPHSNLRRGFCIVQAFDLISFNKILNAKDLQFQDRILKVEKFRQGQELAAHNALEESRRVILKRVPSGTLITELCKILELCIGAVKRIYRFEPEDDKAMKKSAHKKWRTYSVEFYSIESAAKAVNVGLFQLDWMAAPVSIEAFKRPYSPTTEKHNRIAIGPFILVESKIAREDLIYGIQNLSTCLPPSAAMLDFGMKEGVSFLRAGQSNCYSEWSSIKPTKKLYFKLRETDFELRMAQSAALDRRQLRFNRP